MVLLNSVRKRVSLPAATLPEGNSGSVDHGPEIGFVPVIEGGFAREGLIAADGLDKIRVFYDFESSGFIENSADPERRSSESNCC